LQRAADEGAKLTTLIEFTEVSPRQLIVRAMLALAVLLAGACAGEPHRPTAPAGNAAPAPNQSDTAPAPLNGNPVLERVAATARQMVGAPYKYGGRTPRGFDCSGLVFYVYGEAGVTVPRTAKEQLLASHSLALKEAAPGDLLFFKEKNKVSHVGIYLGGQRFVHAPSTGKAVVTGTLDDDYYQRRLIWIGRLDVVN